MIISPFTPPEGKDQTTVFVHPGEAINSLKSARGALRSKTLFLAVSPSLYVTAPNEAGEYTGVEIPHNLKATRAQILDYLQHAADYSARRVNHGKSEIMVRVAVYSTCAFFG